MNNESPFCGKCDQLNMTEEQQNRHSHRKDHVCYRYDMTLKHLNDHPNINRCLECVADNLPTPIERAPREDPTWYKRLMFWLAVFQIVGLTYIIIREVLNA